jgi:hypothetical protein
MGTGLFNNPVPITLLPGGVIEVFVIEGRSDLNWPKTPIKVWLAGLSGH